MKPTLLAGFSVAALAAATLSAPANAASPCAAAVHSMLNYTSYHGVMNVTVDGKPIVTTMDVVKPDRVHVTMMGTEMVVIGKSGWQRTGSGAWSAAPGMDGASLISPPAGLGTEYIEKSCIDAGMGMWQGTPAHRYKATYLNVKKAVVTSTLYVDGSGMLRGVQGGEPKSPVTMTLTQINSASVTAPK